ncbi:MAG: thioesterase family protein [Gammaproteobacteria bacterium]|nr:thioesterase family protein [Gammaproteobacteria bacterium]
MTQPTPSPETYPYRVAVPARWGDADLLGHINNVAYYRYFEVVVVDFIARPCGIDWLRDPVIPYAAESRCRFLRPLRFPGNFLAALRVVRIGTTSVTYDLALFDESDGQLAATGDWVHVFVDRTSERPVAIPRDVRDALEAHRAGEDVGD